MTRLLDKALKTYTFARKYGFRGPSINVSQSEVNEFRDTQDFLAPPLISDYAPGVYLGRIYGVDVYGAR